MIWRASSARPWREEPPAAANVPAGRRSSSRAGATAVKDAAPAEDDNVPTGRGLHSSTFQLNLSVFYGIGGACRGYLARIKGVFGVCGCFLVSDTAQVDLRSGRV